MDKTVMIIAGSDSTADCIAKQIHLETGGKVSTRAFALDDGCLGGFESVMIVFSSKEIREEAVALGIRFVDCDQIVATRVPNYHVIFKLLDIDEDDRVVVMNDSETSVQEGHHALRNFGFEHISMTEWHPGCPEVPDVEQYDVAVIFGEPHLVPLGMKKVIDLGPRVIDHYSIIRVMQYGGMEDAEVRRYSDAYYKQAFRYVSISDRQSKVIMEINAKLESGYFDTVKAIATAVDAKDHYTGGHCERVMNYSIQIGQVLGFTKQDMDILKFSSVLHDVGKIGIPDALLSKPGSFTPEEYALIQNHSLIGSEIIRSVDSLRRVSEIIRDHHERPDGTGYPAGKQGEAIDPYARIIAVVDAYDAMTTSRPYRVRVHGPREAIAELRAHGGTQFDAEIVRIFTGIIEGELAAAVQ